MAESETRTAVAAGDDAGPARRRWTALAVTLGMLGGIGGLGIWGWSELQRADRVPIRKVLIEGELRYLERAHLAETAGPYVRGGFFSVDVEGVRKVIAALPWVDHASVRRVWPDTLRIRVEEQVPVAMWGEDALLNPRGEVFAPTPGTFPTGLPRLSGPDDRSGDVLGSFRRMSSTLQAVGLGIDALALDERRAWTIDLNNGLRVLIGRNQPEIRLARFARLFDAVLAQESGRIGSVDLRYTNGVAVRWKPDDEA